MSISLFPHNQTAYESLLSTLETARRACVIHPTGTGKSFIGFKYCEDHPELSVLWLPLGIYFQNSV
jgi:DNA or RNA helicases of superfamily II